MRLFHPVHQFPVRLVQRIEIPYEVVRQGINAEQVFETRVDRDQEVFVRDAEIHRRKISRTDQNASATAFHMPLPPSGVLNWVL